MTDVAIPEPDRRAREGWLAMAFEEMPEGWEASRPRPVLFGWSARQLLAAVALLLMVSAIVAGRLLP